MTESTVPVGLKIRVLTTIEDGETHHEIIRENHFFGTVEDFVTVGHQRGLFVSREIFKQEIAEARGCITMALKVLDGRIREFPEDDTSDECMALCEVEKEVQNTLHHLNKIFIGE
ncbi:hypothetical protein [Enterobacter mori]|uniref:hypothetical protein n=1 Tax=Enterobacter mori TaxID=539813 RepID=UPI003B844CFC